MAGRKKVLLKVGFLIVPVPYIKTFKTYSWCHVKSTSPSADHNLRAGDHFGRQWGGKDVTDEPVREQEVQQPVQGHDWGRLPHQGGDGRRQAGHHADLGHCWTGGALQYFNHDHDLTLTLGEVPVTWSGFLSRGRLLRSHIRRNGAQHLQVPRQLERRVLDPSQPQRPRQLSLCRAWQ